MPSIIEEFEEPVDSALLSGEEPTVEDEQKGTEETDITVSSDEGREAEQAEKKESEPEEKEQSHQRSQHIPRERFDEVHGQLKEERAAREALEERLAALEKKPEPVVTVEAFDIKAKLKEYNAALIDGEEDRAMELAEEIETERTRRAEETADRRAEARINARDQKREQQEIQTVFSQTVAKMVEAYPALDSTSETKDQAAIDEVVEWRDFYMSKGEKPHVALEKAAKKVMGEPVTSVVHTDKRKEAQTKLNADTSKRQPPVASGTGARYSDVKSAVPDKQEDWDKLPETERKKLLQ